VTAGRAADALRGATGPRLGFGSLLALGLNGIIGVGIFFAPSELARLLGGLASAWAFGFTALLLVPVAWAYGRLGSAFAEDGGPYVWARAALGERFAFGVGFVAYCSGVLSTSAVVFGLGQYLGPVLGFASPWGAWIFRVLAALIFSGLTLLGLRPSAWMWSLLTLVKLAPLVLLAVLGARGLAASGAALGSGAPGFGSLTRAALLAVFPLQGFEIVAVPAGAAGASGERSRAVLAATLGSLLSAALLYVLLQSACVLAVPKLAESSAPIVEAGARLTGGAGRGLFSAGTNVSAVGIAFGMFAMTPRYLSALGTAGLFGVSLSRERAGVPVLATLVTAAGVLLFVSLSGLGRLLVLSSLAVLLQYAVSAVSLFILATRRERGLGRVDRLLAPLCLASIALLVRSAQPAELVTLGGIVVCGFVLLACRRALARGAASG
jgi:amino acid transporter